MIKKINSYMNLSILISFLYVIFGFMLLLFPDTSVEVITVALGTILVATGVILFVRDLFGNARLFFVDGIVTGILLFVIGLLILTHRDQTVDVVGIVLGIWFIINSIVRIRVSIGLREYEDTSWIGSLILSIASLVCGIVFICMPMASVNVSVQVLGVVTIIYAVCDIIDMFIVKNYVKEIVKYIKDRYKQIED